MTKFHLAFASCSPFFPLSLVTNWSTVTITTPDFYQVTVFWNRQINRIIRNFIAFWIIPLRETPDSLFETGICTLHVFEWEFGTKIKILWQRSQTKFARSQIAFADHVRRSVGNIRMFAEQIHTFVSHVRKQRSHGCRLRLYTYRYVCTFPCCRVRHLNEDTEQVHISKSAYNVQFSRNMLSGNPTWIKVCLSNLC